MIFASVKIMKKKSMRLCDYTYIENNYQGTKDWNRSPSPQ